MAACRQLITP